MSKIMANPINWLENLYSTMTQFKNINNLYDCMEIQSNFIIVNNKIAKNDLKQLLKWEKVNILLVDRKLIEAYNNENQGNSYLIVIQHQPMEVLTPKNL